MAGGESAEAIDILASVSGRIASVRYGGKTIVVAVPGSLPDASALLGQTLRIFNEKHTCTYRIAGAETVGKNLTFTLAGSEVFTGRVRITSVDREAHTVSTRTTILYPFSLSGMHLVTEDLAYSAPIVSAQRGAIKLAPGYRLDPFVGAEKTGGGKDAWIADFGVGDRVEIERFIHRGAL